MLYYIVLFAVGAVISVPILFLLFKLNHKISLAIGILWGLLSILPYFGVHELDRVPTIWKAVTFPAWLSFSAFETIAYDSDFFLHNLIDSYHFLEDVLNEILEPVLALIGPPLLGGFIVVVITIVLQRLRTRRRPNPESAS